MVSLKIKYQNQKCLIECVSVDFSVFLNEFKEKLTNRFFFKEGYFEAFFSFPFALKEKELEKLYATCTQNNTYIMGIEYEENEKSILLEHCFFSGEEYRLNQECIYIGDIDKDVHIITNKNIYVVGNIQGIIDLLHPECEVSASSFDDAKIRIFDSKFQNMTNFAPCKVYYENEELRKQ